MRREDRDLPALTVLALLRTGPRHTYEMQRFVVRTHKDFVPGVPRSMYHAAERLRRDGLIAVHGTERDAGRPERTAYALTDAGRTALTDRVRRLLATPDRDADLLVAGLSFLGCLDSPADAAAALRERAAALDTAIGAARHGLATAPVPRLLLVETEFDVARLTAERDWAAGLAGELESGALPWLDAVPDGLPDPF